MRSSKGVSAGKRWSSIVSHQDTHNFLGRERAIKGTCRIDIPPDDTRQPCGYFARRIGNI